MHDLLQYVFVSTVGHHGPEQNQVIFLISSVSAPPSVERMKVQYDSLKIHYFANSVITATIYNARKKKEWLLNLH